MAIADTEAPTLGRLAEQSRERLKTMERGPALSERDREVRGVIQKTTMDKKTTLATTNGPAAQKEAIDNRYNGVMRETKIAEKLDESWLKYGVRKAGEAVSAGVEVAKTPFRWAVNAVKNHPYLTIGATTLVAGGLIAYFTGFGATALAPIIDWLGRQPGEVRKVITRGVGRFIRPGAGLDAGISVDDALPDWA